MANAADGEAVQKDASSALWFYTQHGETYGPVSLAELRAAAVLGFVKPSDMVRRGDQATWVLARSLSGLFKQAG